MKNLIKKLIGMPKQPIVGRLVVPPHDPKYHKGNVSVGDVLHLSCETELVTVRRIFPEHFTYGRSGFTNWNENCAYRYIIANHGTEECRRKFEARIDDLLQI